MKVCVYSIENLRVVSLGRVELETRLRGSLAEDGVIGNMVTGGHNNVTKSAPEVVALAVAESTLLLGFDRNERASKLGPSQWLHACDGHRRVKYEVAGFGDEVSADTEAARSSTVKKPLQQVSLSISYLAAVLLAIERDLDGNWQWAARRCIREAASCVRHGHSDQRRSSAFEARVRCGNCCRARCDIRGRHLSLAKSAARVHFSALIELQDRVNHSSFH